MPNTITSEQLANLQVPGLDRRLQLKPVGWIQPTGARDACEAVIHEIAPCVLYCEVVDGRAMKFGTAGSLLSRQKNFNRRTINNILAFQDGRYRGTNKKITDPSTYDKYKRGAPEVIRSGKSIEVWAVALSSREECLHPLKSCDARCPSCKEVEGALNDHFETVQHGWASRRN